MPRRTSCRKPTPPHGRVKAAAADPRAPTRTLTDSSIRTWTTCGILIHMHFTGGSSDRSVHQAKYHQQRHGQRTKSFSFLLTFLSDAFLLGELLQQYVSLWAHLNTCRRGGTRTWHSPKPSAMLALVAEIVVSSTMRSAHGDPLAHMREKQRKGNAIDN